MTESTPGPQSDGPRGQRLVATIVVTLALATGLILGIVIDRSLLIGRRHMWSRSWHRMGAERGGPMEGPEMGGPGRPMGGPPPDGLRRRLIEELKLTPPQVTALDSIMSRQMKTRRAVEDSMFARMHASMDSARAALDKILTPEQRTKFEALRARRDSMRRSLRDR